MSEDSARADGSHLYPPSESLTPSLPQPPTPARQEFGRIRMDHIDIRLALPNHLSPQIYVYHPLRFNIPTLHFNVLSLALRIQKCVVSPPSPSLRNLVGTSRTLIDATKVTRSWVGAFQNMMTMSTSLDKICCDIVSKRVLIRLPVAWPTARLVSPGSRD